MNSQLAAAVSASTERLESTPARSAAIATISGPPQWCAERRSGPASKKKPPAMMTMTRTTSAVAAAATSGLAMRTLTCWEAKRVLQNRQQAGVLLLPFWRKCPLFAKPFVELGTEKIVLQAAVNDVPRQHFVRRTIAEHEEVGIDARFGDGRPPVSAVALSRFDGVGHAPVPERQQRLIERMPFRLDVEVDVVDAAHERAHPLDLAVDGSIVFHRQPLVRRSGFRHERVHTADDAPKLTAAALVAQHDVAKLQRKVANRDEIVVSLRRQPNHEVELQVVETAGEDHLRRRENLVVRDRLVDDTPQPIGSCFRRDRNRALTASAEQFEDRRREIIEAKRGGANRVAHVDQLRENLLDLGVVAQRDRHEAGTGGVLPRVSCKLQDPIFRKGSNRKVVVTRPA